MFLSEMIITVAFECQTEQSAGIPEKGARRDLDEANRRAGKQA